MSELFFKDKNMLDTVSLSYTPDADMLPFAAEHTADSDDAFDSYYGIRGIAERCSDPKYTNIALQLPDALLCDAARIISRLSHHLAPASPKKLFVLGDTSYGSCCVDEVAAKHLNADLVVHFGKSCISKTASIPVYFAFCNRSPLKNSELIDRLRAIVEKYSQIVLVWDLEYTHTIDAFADSLRTATGKKLCKVRLAVDPVSRFMEAAATQGENSDSSSDFKTKLGYFWIEDQLDLADGTTPVVYYGEECLALTNMMLSVPGCNFFTANPQTGAVRHESADVSRVLKRRYFLINKAKDAENIGIVAGTLGVARHVEMIDRIKTMIKDAGKKSYTFIVGKINEAKLANFADIDMFVLVACPFSSLVDSRQFFRPIITPFECEIALTHNRIWTGREYITDFSTLFASPSAAHHDHHNSASGELQDNDEVRVSLTSSTTRVMATRAVAASAPVPAPENDNRDIVTRNAELALSVTTAGHRLQSREYIGLVQDLGQTPVTLAVQGRSGIAMHYSHESKDVDPKVAKAAGSGPSEPPQ